MTKQLYGTQTSSSLSDFFAVTSDLAVISPATITASARSVPTFSAPSFAAAPPTVVTPAAGVTPTVAQLLDAANAEYTTSGTPPGMAAFLVNGKQLSVTDNTTGLAAKVWITDQGQVIIAYQGTTGGNNIFTDPIIALSQLGADLGIYDQKTPAAETGALTFANQVLAIAAKRGISAANVFVTGHSLGGIEAEYVAQQTGLGGIGFEPTGLPASSTAKGTGQNFVDVVTYGDPVGNYSSDIAGEQPFAPGAGLDHYGQIVMIGDPADQAQLTAAASTWNTGLSGDIKTLGSLATLLADYHLPDTQAYNLGVTLSPYSSLADSTGDKTGPMLNAGNLTIAQFIEDYGSASAAAAFVKTA